jgi:poly(3-hydroxybutyrate) depolymerase
MTTLATARAHEAPVISDGAGRVEIRIRQESRAISMRLWYYRPPELNSEGRVLFVLHGVGRNADEAPVPVRTSPAASDRLVAGERERCERPSPGPSLA